MELVRKQLDELINRVKSNVGDLDSQIAEKQTAVRRLIRLGALAGDDTMSEIATELRRYTDQIRQLEAEKRAALRTPAETLELLAVVEREAKKTLNDFRKTLRKDPEGAREVY